MIRLITALALIPLAWALPEAPTAVFRTQVIDNKITIGYGLAIADVDGDGKNDVLLVDAGETVWYHNPSWEKRALTGKLTEKDHVCLCAADITGDGLAEIAVGAEWNPGDTTQSGAVFALYPQKDRLKIWEPKPLHHEPTVHRMQWVREQSGGYFLAVLPLHGIGNKDGEGEGINFLGYRTGTDPSKDWQTFLIHKGFHLAHNFDPVRWSPGKAESLLIACKEGIHLIAQADGKWEATRITDKPAGEVRLGRSPDGKRFIATVEPMHGNEVVINPESADGLWSDKRLVIDDTLNQGHALVTGDFLGLGYDQVVAGWREPNQSENKVGLRLYLPTEQNGSKWKLHSVIDDNTMACEDLKAADLDQDGKIDLIASGRATKNVVVYWNKSTP
ncbi:MAG: VCBS repeat-containing protein [Armatimonadetes bacterium]|nr:VCBS repeat-containing protein [Akkermansiaceae bacterium]